MDFRALLQLQASLLVFAGGIVLLAHFTSRSPGANAGARWFFVACVSGALGLGLQSERGFWPLWLTVGAGNFLFFLLIVLMTHSVALFVQVRDRILPALAGVAMLCAGAMIYYAYPHPDLTRRVLIALLSMPVMLGPALVYLLTQQQTAIRVPCRVLAGILLFFIVACLGGAAGILHGAHPQSGASPMGAILISGAALCILWMDLLRLREELEQQAMTDPLTGLLNRRAVEMLGERELSRAVRAGTSVTLLTVDIDEFKGINDRFGHMIGDRALVAVAEVLKRTTRSGDLTVRNGGDEFVVLLIESSTEIATLTVRRIRDEVGALRVTAHDGREFPVSVTVGSYTSQPGTQQSYADLMHASDMDLYLSKQQRSSAEIAIAAPESASVKRRSHPIL